MTTAGISKLIEWHKNEIKHCEVGHAAAKSVRQRHRWYVRRLNHRRTVACLRDLLKATTEICTPEKRIAGHVNVERGHCEDCGGQLFDGEYDL